ncbi:MAG TPA: multifunctional oxoglutarate decarboxylase/oxoglutarate dehydrogenase thiamine pyrophosphate-binding subunit/dihydrolipoyllysine-residue succinyltransferase subunit [Ignavibacteria bacterium]|nr:multifunctional oxoglutarate decarboxylase/oxoglutarate dehydrogenase thiamine pyrophosphate-binding subunit/dihydrolipoyllysine-residue succinyltransferase subunit [Ignavibacteria bacterium]HRK00892.1 multifunctional oxoglutarate decarboxylase/oxoglutarate dehydrogenase thiamine pyrophosphate-binding subunit/dihydrolipoyllysine-residue succinyltransferase subunit [Ignavibacteria bacterium]
MKLEDLTAEQQEKISEFGVNTWYVLELLSQYKSDPDSVSDKWKDLFKDFNTESVNGIDVSSDTGKKDTAKITGNTQQINIPLPGENEEAQIIRGVGAKIIDNMNGSLTIPTATTFRTIPVKVLEENRRIINDFLKNKNLGKISYTHLIGWAIVKGISIVPVMNNSYTVINGEPNLVKKQDVNLGLAVDLEKKDGSRSLIVPNIKKANLLNFHEYFQAYNDIIDRSRKNKIEIQDFQGTSITLTNPGTIGTVASTPRLMLGQGAIIATGAIDYPAEYQAVTREIITTIGISKIMNITSTYDHRIIQGAESGLFLKELSGLLRGENNFYEEIFADLGIPMSPVKWYSDKTAEDLGKIDNLEEIERQAKAIQLINMYRVRGHLLANLDPLYLKVQYHPELDPSNYGFTVWDYDREFITDGLGGLRTATLRKILEILHQTYCNKIGVEYRHIQDPEQKKWLQEKMEPRRNQPEFSSEEKKHILFKISEAENFEKFIDKKYIGHKRFSLEGSETIIATLDHLLSVAADYKVDEMVLGMAHRGRLNVLANIIGKSMSAIFSEFEGYIDPVSSLGSGDVKYHLGASGEYHTFHDKKIKVSVVSNPSHLEFVNPVVEGIVRAKQMRMKDLERNKIIPVLIHGDAAVAGEGIVAETLNLSQLHGYKTGGTVHIIINNQIGFTTSPIDARSSVYASDVAKMIQAPIFHVNGDDPEATMFVTKLAFEYRMKFNKDVFIDVFGYRRLGHNEADEPAFTQPIMYKTIRSHPSVKEIYTEKLLSEKIITPEEIEISEKIIYDKMNEGHEIVQKFKSDIPLAVTKEEILKVESNYDTFVPIEKLNEIVKAITYIPEDFHLHPKLRKFIESRREFLDKDIEVDWAFAESLAYGSLLQEGIPVRLSGQDSSRGTFSQRHVVLTDSENGKEIIPLNNVAPEKALIEPLDSLLSEAAVLGFEYGYSTADPITLVLWEAQFGDFVNAAQVIIDNFIASSYTKWGLPNNIVLLLPHAQEGQGPEHSSARVERFLTICADDSMIVCNVTTASQYFHLLRKQTKHRKRRPLVILTPKSLLRLPEAKSVKSDFTSGKFMEIIDDTIEDKSDIKSVIITSGKVYYDLKKYQKENEHFDTAIVRLEQYYPYKSEVMKEILSSYKKASKVIWVQEEPRNMGAWNFLAILLQNNLSKWQKLYCVSRKESSSPAEGSLTKYNESQAEILRRAFSDEQIQVFKFDK